MEEKYRIYKDILSKDLQTNYVFFGVFLTLMIIGTVIFAFWGKSTVQEYKKQTIKKNRKKNSTKKQKTKFILNLLVFILFCLTIIIGIPQQIIQISNFRSDIKNESFVIYDSEFIIYSQTHWPRRGPTYTEYIIRIDYETHTINLEIPIAMKNEHSLSEGEYSDMVIVYGEKSKKIVDIYKQ